MESLCVLAGHRALSYALQASHPELREVFANAPTHASWGLNNAGLLTCLSPFHLPLCICSSIHSYAFLSSICMSVSWLLMLIHFMHTHMQDLFLKGGLFSVWYLFMYVCMLGVKAPSVSSLAMLQQKACKDDCVWGCYITRHVGMIVCVCVCYIKRHVGMIVWGDVTAKGR